MNKKISLLTLCLIYISGSQSAASPTEIKVQKDSTFPTAYFNATRFKISPFNRPNWIEKNHEDFFPALLAWDLNKVVLAQESFKNQVSWAYQTYGIRETCWLFYKSMALLKLKSDLKKAGDVRGGCWAAVIDDIQDPRLKEILIQATIHANKPNYPVIGLLQELSKAGNNNKVLSNMGQPVIEAQSDHLGELIKARTTSDTTRTEQLTESISEALDSPLIADVTIEDPTLSALTFLKMFLDQPTNVASGQNGNWIAKPSAAIYKRFLDANSNSDKPKQLKIFVDDKEKNVVAALKNGFDVGIVFTTPEELRAILHNLGQGAKKEHDQIIETNYLLSK